MKISVDIDNKLKDLFIFIKAPKMTNEVSSLLKKLEEEKVDKITAYKDSKIFLIDINEIFYFYTEDRKVFLSTENDVYIVKNKLYEIEENLQNTSIIRASKAVIINMDKVLNFEQLFNGNLSVRFINGKEEFISRKYLGAIKEYLKIGGK